MSTSRARRARRSGVPYQPVVPFAVHAKPQLRPATVAALGELAKAAAPLVAAADPEPERPRRPWAPFAGRRHTEETRAKMRAAWARRRGEA